ncbi:MAG TPA: winged helix-turn-helix transcriptional regulator [candidate division Zixibacteria bacterium]|nr:winged helix-turn-helix transcriptional regulator [candidate division Zixibacteria bacterium]
MNKDVKNSEKYEKIKKNFSELVYDEVKFAIVTAIQYYSSLNLKKLSELIGRPETTTIRYVKKLLEDELIIIDIEKTATDWGKFYCLSDYANDLIVKRNLEIDNRVDWVQKEASKINFTNEEEVRDFFMRAILSKENLVYDALSARNNLSLSHNIQKMIANEFSTRIENINDIIEKKGKEYLLNNVTIKPSDIEVYNMTLRVHSMQQLLKLIEVQFKSVQEIERLKLEFEEEAKKDNIPEDDQQLFFFNSFLGSMEFSYIIKNKD